MIVRPLIYDRACYDPYQNRFAIENKLKKQQRNIKQNKYTQKTTKKTNSEKQKQKTRIISTDEREE